MNILIFTLAVSAGIVILAVGIDVGSRSWTKKRDRRKVHWARVREAEVLLYASISKRFQVCAKEKEYNRASAPKRFKTPKAKKPTRGRHRLSAI